MDDGEGVGVAIGKRGGGGGGIGEEVIEGLVHGTIEADFLAGVADGGGGVAVAIAKGDGDAGAGGNLHDAGPGARVIRKLDRFGQAGGRCLVQDAALQRDLARQGEGIRPALGIPGGVLGGVVAAAVAVEQAEDDGALVAAFFRNRACGGIGIARAGEIVAEVHAAETGDHREGGVFQLAHEVAGDIAAVALEGDKEYVVDLFVDFIAQAHDARGNHRRNRGIGRHFAVEEARVTFEGKAAAQGPRDAVVAF